MDKKFFQDNLLDEEFKNYNDSITVRLCNKYYRFISSLNPYNKPYFIRQLIKYNLKGGFIFKFDTNDYNKVIKIFTPKEIEDLKQWRYKAKKEHKITIKLFQEDKEKIKERYPNISKYIDILINNFILMIIREHEETNKKREEFEKTINNKPQEDMQEIEGQCNIFELVEKTKEGQNQDGEVKK